MKDRGYTLLELTVVVFLLGLLLVISVPSVRQTLVNDALKSTVKYLSAAAKTGRSDAVREQVDHVLHFDLDKGIFWTYSADMTPEKRALQQRNALALPDGVKITDISQIGMEKKTDGQVEVRIVKQGHMQPTVIHLARGDSNYTILFSPFFRSIMVYDRYVDLTPEGRERK